jgi:hypothetical protein
MRTVIIQSYRADGVPAWINGCLQSVRQWSSEQGFDYQLAGDDSFRLCGEDYLVRVGDNIRSITNLSRLILVQRAHLAGYDRAIWLDADVFVFAPEQLRIDLTSRYAFARETWISRMAADTWSAFAGVNNSVFVCMAGEPDLEWLISTTRHIARHRQIDSNYQVGGDLIRGMRASLNFQVVENVGMFSNHIVTSLARGEDAVLHAQARFHGKPVYAANLCAGPHYQPPVTEADAVAAMDVLARTRGDVVNAWLAEGPLTAQTYPGFTRFELSRSTGSRLGVE